MPISPPRPKPLPLTALRAFEAAARLGGFAAAADELGVTPGAISAHIKGLEEDLGSALFLRTARGVTLSPLGHRALPEFVSAFDQLGSAVQTLRTQAAPGVVHIAALPSVAQFWLSPRLPGLRAVAPEIEISITAMETPPNLKRTPYDLCLFFAARGGTEVAQDMIFPVCAPSVASKIRTPDDLLHLPCLTDTSWADDWLTWSSVAMPGREFVPRGPVFSLYSLAVEETINGAGVLMGHQALIAEHLKAGTLIAPFETKVPLARPLRLWSLHPSPRSGPVSRVAAWLRQSS